jgi:hypothetical protein
VTLQHGQLLVRKLRWWGEGPGAQGMSDLEKQLREPYLESTLGLVGTVNSSFQMSQAHSGHVHPNTSGPGERWIWGPAMSQWELFALLLLAQSIKDPVQGSRETHSEWQEIRHGQSLFLLGCPFSVSPLRLGVGASLDTLDCCSQVLTPETHPMSL